MLLIIFCIVCGEMGDRGHWGRREKMVLTYFDKRNSDVDAEVK
jgi:hypothetical protein